MIESKELLDAAQVKMDKVIAHLTEELASVRAGKASVNVLNGILVEYYGTPTDISQVASITVPDARTVLVQPWEKNMVKVCEKAIRDSDLGLNPATSGDTIRVPLPPLTEERRRELTKVVKGFGEEAKVAVRNLRRDANTQLERLEKDKEISEDDQRRYETEIQKLTDRFVAEIDKVIAEKDKEIMTV